MSRQFRENWKRLSNRLTPKGPSAMDATDIVRVEDLTGLSGTPLMNVTIVTTPSPYTMSNEEDLIVIQVSGDFTVNLPPTPLVGQVHDIKDGVGDGFTTSKIIDGNGNTIEDIFTDFPLSNNYQSWTVVWNGTVWNLI